MCGIVGYIGTQACAKDVLVDGLRRLEYRGYDSAGIAIGGVASIKQRPLVVRAVGKVSALEEKLAHGMDDGTVGIAHTRWATHGKPSIKNAHPHTAGKITLVHNGIIENYQHLKKELEQKGRVFKSDTDSEVVAHMIDNALVQAESLERAVLVTLGKLRGAYALVILSEDEPEKIIAVKNSSPLVVGVKEDALIFASDASAIIAHTNNVIYPQDGDVIIAQKKNGKVIYEITSSSGALRQREIEVLEWDQEQAQKEGYAHFMIKEIFEQSHSLTDAIRGRIDMENGNARLGGLIDVTKHLQEIQRIIIISCGTSYHAGLIGEYMLEEYAGVPTEVEYASEFRYRRPLIDKNTAVIAISQSGETADTLAAIKEAKNKGALTLGIVNAVGSTIARETDAGVYNHAGPEISVASTKAFTSQLAILALLTVFLGRQRDMDVTAGREILTALQALPQKIEEVLLQNEGIKGIAERYVQYDNFLYIGRKYNFPVAIEGALKIKEISYVHAEGYPSGEMKHGPIALIDEDFPVVAIVPEDSVYEKNLSGIEEIRARHGKVIAITTVGATQAIAHSDDVIEVPKTIEMLMPVLTAVPLQFFSYYVGIMRGIDVDKPRNLAKSVTVE